MYPSVLIWYDMFLSLEYGDCDYEKFYRNVYGDMLKEDSDFWEHCDVKGGKQCSLECQDAVREMYDSACMKVIKTSPGRHH